MPRIVFVEADGTEHAVQAAVGESVMQTAVAHLLPGIVGDCGGSCQCATCHGYVDPDWIGRAGAPTDDERVMLDGVLDLRDNSRLTCQIVVDENLDGLIVRLPCARY
jgi:ferredoxin, 2Fe-2S